MFREEFYRIKSGIYSKDKEKVLIWFLIQKFLMERKCVGEVGEINNLISVRLFNYLLLDGESWGESFLGQFVINGFSE